LQEQAKGNTEKRQYAVMELTETEENFVAVLHTINTAFRVPLEKYANMPGTLVTPEEVATVFLNVKQLLSQHAAFLADLQAGQPLRYACCSCCYPCCYTCCCAEYAQAGGCPQQPRLYPAAAGTTLLRMQRHPATTASLRAITTQSLLPAAPFVSHRPPPPPLCALRGARPRRSPLFTKYQPTFILYGTYCARLPAATKCLEELCSKKGMASHLQVLQENSKQRFSLKDLLMYVC